MLHPTEWKQILAAGMFLLCLAAAPLPGCTIFVLTGTNSAFFCNNEDWSNPKTRIWFVPAGLKRFGCAYVGFNDDFPQGGVNSEGLAFDWVAGYQETWEPDPTAPIAVGNSTVRILETCSTVEQAIAFYRGHREPGFATCKTLIADRTGASVILGAKDGKLQVQTSAHCQGLGYGARTLDTMLAASPQPSPDNGLKILRACRQKGQYATKYSNVYDLKTGDIFLCPFPGQDDMVKLNLAEELRKGGHYYDMLQIKEQLLQPLQPLRADMERGLLEKYHPIPDTEPKVTEHLRHIVEDVANGTMQAADFTEEAWKNLEPQQSVYKWTVKSLGPLQTVQVVDRHNDAGNRCYRYRLEFKTSTLLLFVTFDGQDKLVSADVEDTR